MHLKQEGGKAVRQSNALFFYHSSVFSILLLLAVFLFSHPAVAQEETTDAASIATPELISEPAPATVPSSQDQQLDSESIAQAQQDSTVTEQDLGVNTRFYGFKKFFRPLRKAVTFNKEKDIALEVRYANEDLAHAQRLITNNSTDAQNINKAIEAVNDYERAIEKIKDHSAGVTRPEVLENIIDKQIKQQKILEGIEKRITTHASQEVVADVIEKIDRSRTRAAQHVGEALTRIEQDPEKLANHFDRALERQRGSEFKDIRNLEVLKRLEDHVPAQAKKAIERAQENTIKRFAQQVENAPEGKQAERFERYVHHVDGDDTRHLEVFDHIKKAEGLSPEFIQKLEAAKDIAAQKFKKRVEDFDQKFGDQVIRERMRERMFARFKSAPPVDGSPDGPRVLPEVQDIGKLRVLEEIRQRVEFDNEEIKKKFEAEHEASIKEFKNAFTDDASQQQAERFRELTKKMAENPDPTTFRLLQQLEEEVRSDPKKRAFIEQMEREAKAEFAQEAQKHGKEFFDRIISSNPQDIEVFKTLQREFEQDPEKFIRQGPPGGPGFPPPPFGDDEFGPPGFGPDGFGPPPGFDRGVFDQLIDHHSEGIAQHLKEIDDPELFKQFQKKFDQGPQYIAEELKRRHDDFGRIYHEKARYVDEGQVHANREIDAARRELEQEREAYKQELERKMNELKAQGDFEGVKRLEEEKNKKEDGFSKRTIELERKGFDANIKFNPFCDEQCQKEEGEFFEKMIREREDAMKDLWKQGGPQFDGDFPPASNMPVDPRQVCMHECTQGTQCAPGNTSDVCESCVKKCGLKGDDNRGPEYPEKKPEYKDEYRPDERREYPDQRPRVDVRDPRDGRTDEYPRPYDGEPPRHEPGFDPERRPDPNYRPEHRFDGPNAKEVFGDRFDNLDDAKRREVIKEHQGDFGQFRPDGPKPEDFRRPGDQPQNGVHTPGPSHPFPQPPTNAPFPPGDIQNVPPGAAPPSDFQKTTRVFQSPVLNFIATLFGGAAYGR